MCALVHFPCLSLTYEHKIHQTDDQNFEVYKSTLVFAFHAALCFHNCRSTPNARDLCFANSCSSCSVFSLCCGWKKLQLSFDWEEGWMCRFPSFFPLSKPFSFFLTDAQQWRRRRDDYRLRRHSPSLLAILSASLLRFDMRFVCCQGCCSMQIHLYPILGVNVEILL